MLSGECRSTDHLESVLLHDILQLEERIFVLAASVCGDQGGRCSVSCHICEIFREEGGNTAIVDGHSEKDKVIFCKLENRLLLFID